MAFQRSRDATKAMWANIKGKANDTRTSLANKVDRAQSNLESTKKNSVMHARQAMDWSISHARAIPVEKYVTQAFDFPFTWMEGLLSNDIDKRVSNIKKVAANQLGAYQRSLTESYAKRARSAYEKRIGPVKEGDAYASTMRNTSLAAMEKHLQSVTSPQRNLRSTVDNKKFDQMVSDWWQSALREGKQHFSPSAEERAMLLAKFETPVTSKNEQELVKRLQVSYILGLRPDVMGDNRVGGL